MTLLNPMPDYPFDPLDWATITPLYEALQTAPVTSDQFTDWWSGWNHLNNAIWDAYTWLKQRAYFNTDDQAAGEAYQKYVEQLYSTYLEHTDALRRRALSLQPEPPNPDHAQLWRTWRNQIALFKSESVPIQAEISQLEGRYREIMNQYQELPGQPHAYWLARRSELNDLMLRLLDRRRSLARVCGEPNFLAYRWRELDRLDYTPEDCQSFHRAVETEVAPLLAHCLAGDLTPAPEFADGASLRLHVARILEQVDPAFAQVFDSMGSGYLDLGHRAGKTPAVEAWFFPLAAMPYLHVSTGSIGSVLHETGHALHYALSFQAQPSLWMYGGPDEFQEFAAMTLEMLCWPHYAQAGGPLTSAESAASIRASLKFYLESLTRSVMQDAFEHWVYGSAPEDVTSADLDRQWLDLTRRYMPGELDEPESDVVMTGWQRWNWSLYRIPLYMIAYPIALVGLCQFAQTVATDRAQAVERYKAALSRGNTRPLGELFLTAGVRFPFSSDAVAAAGRQISQWWEDTAP